MLFFKTCLFITHEKISQKSTKTKIKNNKRKIIAPTWNGEFELHDSSCSLSDIKDYIGYITKTMKHYPPILLFIFPSTGKIKDAYKLEPFTEYLRLGTTL